MENFLDTNINSSETNQTFYKVKGKICYSLDVPNFTIIENNEHFEGRDLIVLSAANIFHNVRLFNDVKMFIHVNNILRTQALKFTSAKKLFFVIKKPLMCN